MPILQSHYLQSYHINHLPLRTIWIIRLYGQNWYFSVLVNSQNFPTINIITNNKIRRQNGKKSDNNHYKTTLQSITL